MGNNGRIWTREELMIAYHVYFNKSNYRDPIRYLSNLLHRTEGSINMRLGNYDFFSSNGRYGLENGGARAESAFREYTSNPLGSAKIAIDMIAKYESRA